MLSIWTSPKLCGLVKSCNTATRREISSDTFIKFQVRSSSRSAGTYTKDRPKWPAI